MTRGPKRRSAVSRTMAAAVPELVARPVGEGQHGGVEELLDRLGKLDETDDDHAGPKPVPPGDAREHRGRVAEFPPLSSHADDGAPFPYPVVSFFHNLGQHVDDSPPVGRGIGRHGALCDPWWASPPKPGTRRHRTGPGRSTPSSWVGTTCSWRAYQPSWWAMPAWWSTGWSATRWSSANSDRPTSSGCFWLDLPTRWTAPVAQWPQVAEAAAQVLDLAGGPRWRSCAPRTRPGRSSWPTPAQPRTRPRCRGG